MASPPHQPLHHDHSSTSSQHLEESPKFNKADSRASAFVPSDRSSPNSRKPTDNSWESHPLFLNRMPLDSDFENNPLLSAIAALIDDSQQDTYHPHRKQRQDQRSKPYGTAPRPQGKQEQMEPMRPSDDSKAPSFGELQMCMSTWKMKD